MATKNSMFDPTNINPFESNVESLVRRNPIFTPKPFDVPVTSVEENQLPIRREEYDVNARMNQLYTPENQMQQRYNTLLERMPSRDNYKPSLGRAILAGIVSAKNPEYGENLFYRRFNQDNERWNQEADFLKDAANMERGYNTNMKSVASSIINQELADRRLDRQYERDEVLLRQGDERLKGQEERHRLSLEQRDKEFQAKQALAEARLQLAEEVALGGQIVDDGYGGIHIVRKDGSVITPDLTKISEQEKAAIRARYQMQVKQTQTGNAANPSFRLSSDANGNPILVLADPNTKTATPVTMDEIPEKNKNKPVVAGPPKTVNPNTESSANLRNTRIRAATYAAQNPNMAKYIKIPKEASGMPTLVSPGRFTGPNQADWQAAKDAIFGSGNYNNNTQTQTTAPSVRVIIYKNGQAVGTVPANQVEEAKRQGYTVK